VLVHGLASNSRLWDGAASALAELGYHVVSLDQRGHGLSDKPDDGYDMATVVDDLARLIKQLGLQRPIVAGQSWGGNVVVELAHRHPGATRGVCAVDGGLIQLCDRFASWDECVEALQPPRLAGSRADGFANMMRRVYAGWPETAIVGALANMQHHDDGTISPWLTFDRHIKVLRGLWEHRPHDILPTITVPVLFTPADSGDAWSSEKRREYDTITKQNERVKVQWFSPAHHDLHAQFPERWATALHENIVSGFLA
jgi:pimeloyl-ACP methyl ester carboxylesterase